MRPGFFLKEAFRALSRNAAPSLAAMLTVLLTALVLGVFIPIVQATTGTANGVRSRVVVDVFVKQDAAWQMALAHGTRIHEGPIVDARTYQHLTGRSVLHI